MEFRKMHHKVVIKLIAVQLLTKDQKIWKFISFCSLLNSKNSWINITNAGIFSWDIYNLYIVTGYEDILINLLQYYK